jgi:UDP-N-acetylmuramoyl-tripeptide--D-alanyl-D-alanine ligase
MIAMQLSEAAQSMRAVLHGRDGEFSGCSTDSRTLPSGALFFALRGEQFDGHRFIAEAFRRGASGAVVEREVADAGLPLLAVKNTRQALGQLAGAWRQRFQVPMVAVTGSNGKTTVKEMLASIFSPLAPTLVTPGNFNNDVGVPLTLFGLGNEHRFGVIEMGANHAGEIAALTLLVRPQVAVITQCAPAHLEGFGSVDGVARAKSEIYAGLDAGGTAVINADETYAEFWRSACAGRQQLSFGLRPGADVTAASVAVADNGMSFLLGCRGQQRTIHLQLYGRHNVVNALAATACAIALNIPLERIAAGLESMRAVKGRLQLKAGRHAARVLDDTYNANPASLGAALGVLESFPGRRWLVLGDMGELGPTAPELHARAGASARAAGVERLFALGPLSRFAVQSFGTGAGHFASSAELVSELAPALAPDVTVLVKGSRAMAMERVVAGIGTGT